LPDDSFVKNEPQAHTRGLPVRLKVPTHVEVVITEDFFIEKRGANSNASYQEIRLTDDRNNPLRITSLETNVIYTDKVFTVDFNRPAGGILDVTSTFDKEQYFATITATYTERTLADINTAISTLKPVLARASAVRLAAGATATLATDKREVARARFDISDCNWEEQLHAFVDQHITGCYLGCDPRR
jgi:hypothetical protein